MNTIYQPYYQKSWALVIGINNYLYVSPLSYAVNDADAITQILVNELGFLQENVVTLKNQDATKQVILDNFLDLSNKACDPDDRVLVFFAGHGLSIDGLRGPIGYLLPVDGNPDNKNSLIRWDDLTRNADLIPAKHILFIMDACYSGLATKRAITPGSQRFLSDMLQRLARQVITAGKADETVADGGGPQGKNSIFTGYLIEGLMGEAADENKILTANELMAYVYKKVGQDTRSQQTPHYGHLDGDGDFIIRTPNNEHLMKPPSSDYLIKTATEVPEVTPVSITPAIKPSFIIKNGYGDTSTPNFGRNIFSDKLGEYRRGKEYPPELSKAYSWLSIIIEPITDLGSALDITVVSQTMKSYKPKGEKPYEILIIPRGLMTTFDAVVLYDELINTEYWGWYTKIDRNGNIELTNTRDTFMEYSGVRCFFYVQIVGIIWQSVFFAKNVYQEAGYFKGVRLWVNLVGTQNSILIDFSKESGEKNQHWVSPFDRNSLFDQEHLFKLKCQDQNLQMEYKFVVGNLDEMTSFEIIKNIANNLGLAYNHQSLPRCFNYNTEIFPWGQYFNGKHY
jgi:hypothetical protein